MPAPGRWWSSCEATPFYGEQGGQTGDTGRIESAAGAAMQVSEVKRPVPTMYVHSGDAGPTESLRVGDTVDLIVDVDRRDATRRNHSATHLLHWALAPRAR